MTKTLLLSLLLIQSSFAKEFIVSISELHPTQLAIGKMVIKKKSKKIEKHYKKGKLSKYLKKKIAPVIIGPDKRYWPTDRHHTSYSILKANIPSDKKQLMVKVIHDWSDLTFEEFSQKMIQNNYAYLKDNSFTEVGFDKLPKRMKDLADNPLRALASLARDEECFEKVNTPFLEFIWAEYFFNSGILNEDQDLENIMKLCHLDNASSLPGFISN